MTSVLVDLLRALVPILLVLGVVITVHELGHFLVGKAVGTKIDQFAIGFGKPWFRHTDKAGVEWRLGWLPVGGFVRFAGDDNAASIPDQDDLEAMRQDLLARVGPVELRRYYHFKPIWQRAAISVAGPLANFALSILIFSGLLLALGQPISTPRVGDVDPGSPAQAAGFLPNDIILKANGQPMRTTDDVRQVIILRSDVPIRFLVDRNGRQVELTAAPRRGPVPDILGRTHQLGKIGVRFKPHEDEMRMQPVGPAEALVGGISRTFGVVDTTIFYLQRMITGHESADQISGPIGMAQLSGSLEKQTAATSHDLGSFLINSGLNVLQLIAVISVGIGFLNLMPIPVLDGGHLLFYAYEALARRPLAAKVQAVGYRVGRALVLGLMLFATWNDLQRLHVFNFLGGLHS